MESLGIHIKYMKIKHLGNFLPELVTIFDYDFVNKNILMLNDSLIVQIDSYAWADCMCPEEDLL